MRRRTLLGAGAVIAATAGVLAVANATPAGPPDSGTPIKHVVVIFDENESFDHYFATYPDALNKPGETQFDKVGNPPTPDNLARAGLLAVNPNQRLPHRLGPDAAVTCDQNHNYGAEQLAFNHGQMDKFVENTGSGSCSDRAIVLDYYDGNTLTALWNLAQHFAISDAFFGTTFGPSTPGAINLVSGNTHGVSPAGAGENGTMIGDPQPLRDDCSGSATATMSGRNIGDVMNEKGVTWGWFAGGFRPTSWKPSGDAVCAGSQKNAAGAAVGDYLPHHEPFQYYASTANPHHLRPSSVEKIGLSDEANHQYDLSDFDAALAAGNLPQVSFLKAVAAEDAHPGYSGPADEQHWLVRVLNKLQKAPEWSSTAVSIAYDDSDGWYDHAFIAPQQGSDGNSDALDGVHQCGAAPANGAYRDRCGPGPRLPLLLISPYAKQNFVDSTQTEQTSIPRFIEDNWGLGRIGDQSFDARAKPLDNMFDFVGAPAAKLYLGEDGRPLAGPPATPAAVGPARPDPGLRPTPQATATATAVPTTAPTPARTPTPTPPRKLAIKLSCRPSGGGRRITVSCAASGPDAAKKTSLRFDIKRKSKLLATGKAT